MNTAMTASMHASVNATGSLYLSRARLRRDVPAVALRHLLVADDASARTATTHRLVWTLFADAPDRERDFLWREAEPGLFYLLSRRPPDDHHRLFHLDPPKPFAPEFAEGDRLAFALRANATVARHAEGKPRAKDGRVRGGRCDVVMDALHGTAAGGRAESRLTVLDGVAHAWLGRQGERSGFVLDPLVPPVRGDAEDCDDVGLARRGGFSVAGYRVLRVDRGARQARMQLGMLDVEGVLTVRDPTAFVDALGRGFGRAKAFGCGLMLVRRAPA